MRLLHLLHLRHDLWRELLPVLFGAENLCDLIREWADCLHFDSERKNLGWR